MKDLVSVIVPVYNIEKYLEKCVNSIVNQTYKNIEILLIDDGSTDNSGIICDNFAKNDKRIRVVHKKNGGISDVRNLGIRESKGKYLTYIDGDDYIDDDMIFDMVNAMNANNCDMVITKISRDYDNGLCVKDNFSGYSGLYNKIDTLKNGYLNNFGPCNKLFKKEIIMNHEFPVGRVYEDVYTIPDVIMDCENIYFLDKYHYHYMQRGDSIIHSKFSEKKFIDFYESSRKAFNINISGIDEEKEFFYMMTLSSLIYNYDNCIDKKLYKEVLKELKKFKNKYKTNKYLDKKKKIMIGLQINGLGSLSNKIKKTYRKIRYNG